MIWWIYGETGSGKTTLAEKMKDDDTVLLDADVLRKGICNDLGYTEDDRRKNNIRIAHLAKIVSDTGMNVIVSTICPYEDLRQQVYWICKCRFIKVDGKHEAL